MFEDTFKDFNDPNEPLAVIEAFCILMDWEYDTENIIHIEPVAEQTYYIETSDGATFTYDYVNDCIVD